MERHKRPETVQQFGTPLADEQKPLRPDARVEIQGGTATTTLVADVKKTIGRAWVLEEVRHHLKAFNAPGLLVTRYLTPELARQCKNLDLQFMDTAGNGYINQPGMFIQITGQRPEVDPWKEAATFKGFTPTGLKILYAFTCKPELLNAPFREIAKAADVGLGTVADIIADLRTYSSGKFRANAWVKIMDQGGQGCNRERLSPMLSMCMLVHVTQIRTVKRPEAGALRIFVFIVFVNVDNFFPIVYCIFTAKTCLYRPES